MSDKDGKNIIDLDSVRKKKQHKRKPKKTNKGLREPVEKLFSKISKEKIVTWIQLFFTLILTYLIMRSCGMS